MDTFCDISLYMWKRGRIHWDTVIHIIFDHYRTETNEVTTNLVCYIYCDVFILFIYVIYVTNHQNHCKCKMQMSVILCSHGLLDWFNKTILFYTHTMLLECIVVYFSGCNFNCLGTIMNLKNFSIHVKKGENSLRHGYTYYFWSLSYRDKWSYNKPCMLYILWHFSIHMETGG
jgi:hypothetical protein